MENKQLKEKMTNNKQKGEGRLSDPETNPCIKEHELTTKCFVDNNYDQKKCELYFENYRNCKKFWLEVQRDRRIKGIYPYLPPLNEREKIKRERQQ